MKISVGSVKLQSHAVILKKSQFSNSQLAFHQNDVFITYAPILSGKSVDPVIRIQNNTLFTNTNYGLKCTVSDRCCLTPPKKYAIIEEESIDSHCTSYK